MAKLTLLLAFHNHQPDGNFDHVFRQGYDDCYRPLLDAIGDFPRVRLALHHTGPLLEWLDANRPAYLNDLRGLVERGQVEILGGGFYEPMLAVLPDADAQGQLEMMSQFCAERFGARPRGMWLAERVWEPALADTIARAGLGYTLIDDTHFRYAGMTGLLDGYYVTEKAGRAIAIFPIEKELRYAIPFRPADQTIGVLEDLLRKRGGRDVVVTYGDDGEKFGMWPGTKEWVWEKGWLRDFFGRLTRIAEENGPIVTSTFADVVTRTPANDRVYLPTASYEEMGEWTLPADAQERYHAVKSRLEHEQRFEEIRPFFRGGVWQSFLAKYPEANFMHKKMVHVSRKLAATPNAPANATRELYRAQCNCAYWHGLFGGLYLNYLRHAVYSHLIGAELAADGPDPKPRAERLDFDADLRDEVILSNSELWVGIKPDAGGAFFELDVRAKRFNVTNVLGRHPEGYHAKLRAAARAHDAGHGAGESPRSIHDLAKVKESGLEELLHYDRNLRLGLVDHFLAPDTTVDDFARATYAEHGDFATGAYEIVRLTEAGVDLRRTGRVAGRDVTVEKSYQLAGGRLTCRYLVHGEVHAWFAPELSLTLLAGDDAGRRYEADGLPGGARLITRGALPVSKIDLVDEWSKIKISLEAPGSTCFWRFPLETASQSEDGFERTYQGSVLAPIWPLALAPNDSRELVFTISIGELTHA